MADPHIKSPMDWLDYLTVIIYRSGFVFATVSAALLPLQPEAGKLGLMIAAVCCASSLHIYLKKFRLLLQMATWIGLVFYLLGFPMIALGGTLLTLGGLCFKEYFCFRVFGLNFQPVFVALLWFALLFQWQTGILILSAVVAILLLVVSVQKWRMPLHFDIGDKNKYEV